MLSAEPKRAIKPIISSNHPSIHSTPLSKEINHCADQQDSETDNVGKENQNIPDSMSLALPRKLPDSDSPVIMTQIETEKSGHDQRSIDLHWYTCQHVLQISM